MKHRTKPWIMSIRDPYKGQERDFGTDYIVNKHVEELFRD